MSNPAAPALHRFSELGKAALAALKSGTALRKLDAKSEETLDAVQGRFKVLKGSSPALPYPYVLRALRWEDVESAAIGAIRTGSAIEPFYWLCLSALHGSEPGKCYDNLGAALSAYSDFVGDALGWPKGAEQDVADQLDILGEALAQSLRGVRMIVLSTTGDTQSQLRSALLAARREPAIRSCLEATERLIDRVAAHNLAAIGLEDLRWLLQAEVHAVALEPSPQPPKEEKKKLPAEPAQPTFTAPRVDWKPEPRREPIPEPEPQRPLAPEPSCQEGSSLLAVPQPKPVSAPVARVRPAGAGWALPSARTGGLQDPFAYWGRRCELWSQADELARLSGPPSEQEAENLREQIESGPLSPLEALDAAELTLSRYPFWLDLQPLVIRCLERIGATQARDAVRMAAAALLATRPGILGARLASGVRVATEETARVLSADAELLTLPGSSVSKPESVDLPTELGALGLRLKTADSQRTRFLYKLEVAEFCHQQERFDLAVAGFSGLLRDADRFQLSEWEPALLKRLLLAYLRTATERNAPVSEAVRLTLLSQLYQIDPMSAEAL